MFHVSYSWSQVEKQHALPLSFFSGALDIVAVGFIVEKGNTVKQLTGFVGEVGGGMYHLSEQSKRNYHQALKIFRF